MPADGVVNASEEFLGQRDDDARRASHVAGPVLVFVRMQSSIAVNAPTAVSKLLAPSLLPEGCHFLLRKIPIPQIV